MLEMESWMDAWGRADRPTLNMKPRAASQLRHAEKKAMYPRSRVGKRTEGAILGGAVMDYIMDRSSSASIVLVWIYE